MHGDITKITLNVVAFITLLIMFFLSSTAQGSADGCEGVEGYSYVCGPVSAEDLVHIPDSKWIIASGFGGKESMYLIDSEQKTWSNFYPAEEPHSRQDMHIYGSCPGSPNPNNFVAHGLNIRSGIDGHYTMYVVGHGDREAIEVFDVDASNDVPTLTWIGCILTPDGMAANSVASFADGTLVATIPLHTGIKINDAFAGKLTGAVYKWSPGDSGFTKIKGTEMPYANGIEVANDGQEFYVASSGLRKVLAFTNNNPSQLLRSTKELWFIPDNLHMGRNGKLLTAGLAAVSPVCDDAQKSDEFDLKKFASCPRPFTVLAVEPQSMQDSTLASSPAQKHFSNITMALEVRNELWIGTFAGDRIAYKLMEPDSK